MPESMPETIEYRVSNYLVAFIDLLGQSAELSRYPIMPATRDEEFKKWEADTFGRVVSLQFLLTRVIDQYNSASLLSKDYCQVNGMKVKPFSDSIIVYTSLRREAVNDAPMIDVHSIISGICIVMLSSLSADLNFRVGIEIGVGFENDADSFYGSAISAAYDIESNFSDYQRILVGENLYQYLLNSVTEGKRNPNPQNNIIRNEAEQILDLLIPTENNCYMVNYLDKRFTDLFEMEAPDMVHKAYHRIQENIEKYTSLGNEKILGKYRNLKRYFDTYWSRKDV